MKICDKLQLSLATCSLQPGPIIHTPSQVKYLYVTGYNLTSFVGSFSYLTLKSPDKKVQQYTRTKPTKEPETVQCIIIVLYLRLY